MSIVMGVDFGTLSVGVSLFDKRERRQGSGIAEYPLNRSINDPNFATQSHAAQMDALESAMREALAVYTTGSNVITDENLQPLDFYYLWCDHHAWCEAQEITAIPRVQDLKAVEWCGGTYSSEWGFSKLLHWLRNNPEKRTRFATALENCHMVVAMLCGFTSVVNLPRSACAMSRKWMWNAKWGGLLLQEFLSSVDPLFAGIQQELSGHIETSDRIAGTLSAARAERLGLRAGIPNLVGALDAHSDGSVASLRLRDVVSVVGTSTCIIGVSEQQTLVPGVCGVVPGSVLHGYVGIEAGLSVVGTSSVVSRAALDRMWQLSCKISKPTVLGRRAVTHDLG